MPEQRRKVVTISDKMCEDALYALRVGYPVWKIAAAFHTTQKTFVEIMARRGYNVSELAKRGPLEYDIISQKWVGDI